MQLQWPALKLTSILRHRSLRCSFKASVEEEVTSYKQGKKVAKNVKKTVQKIMFAAAADDDTKKIAAKFSVEEAPALFLVFAGHITTYDGEFKKDELKEFLEE